MNADQPIVVVGAGHAGAQLCMALAAEGQGPRVHLVGNEGTLPYQRPPLSKSFLKAPVEPLQWLRNAEWFDQQGITVHRDDPAVEIDRRSQRVRLRSGRDLPYHRLVLATGTRARWPVGLPPALSNVFALRDAGQAHRLRTALDQVQHLTVLGGGFIGLEVAATARHLGMAVTLMEAAPRLLGRSTSPELAEHVRRTHLANGIDCRLGVTVDGFEMEGDELRSCRVNGQREAVQALVLGIGASPESSLAQAAGLACDQGVLVDEHLRTSDEAILAIGDCSRFPARHGGWLRLESIQNANDQARVAAATLMGRSHPYRPMPWFWSDQGTLRLQMAGLVPTDGQCFRRPGAAPASFSLLPYLADKLVCVESVNAPADHLAARKLLEAGLSPQPAIACDANYPLKDCLRA